MPRLAILLSLIALAMGCDRATDPDSLNPSVGLPAFATSDKVVDPAALVPVPPPELQPECRADGRWIICHTTLVIELVNEPVFDLGCGTVYESSTDVRHGIRWYNAADSVIVKRHVTQAVEGAWSLAPGGTAPTVGLTAHANWYDSQYADPADLDSGVSDYHGEIALRVPGFGVIAHIAGNDRPDGTHRGVVRAIDEPAVAAEVCAALTR